MEPYPDIDGINAELCKRSLAFFVQEFWSIIIAEPLVWNWHMEYLCDELQAGYTRVMKRQPKEYDLIINIPPGTSKSTICTIMAPMWSWAVDPTIRHLAISYSDDAINAHSVNARMIAKSQKFTEYFPDCQISKVTDGKTNFKTTKQGEYYAGTVNGSITSKHCHIWTVDDPLNPKQAASTAELSSSIFFFDKTLPTRKVNKDITFGVLVMQRLAVGDPTGHLLGKIGKQIKHICLPAEKSGHIRPKELEVFYKNGLLDENRLTWKNLAELKIDLGSGGYAGQMQQTPVPEGGLIWQKWFIEIDDDKFPSRTMMTDYGSDWDTALTKDEMNAASAYITAGRIQNHIYIDDLGWDWLEFPELIRYMKGKASPHFIEAKSSGQSSKQTLVKEGIPAIEVKVAGGDKIARAKMASPIAESGMVSIRKSLADKLYNDDKQGILMFPRGQFKDLADALAQCLQRLDPRRGKLIVSGGNTSILDDIDDYDDY